jgi:hypothetical protein
MGDWDPGKHVWKMKVILILDYEFLVSHLSCYRPTNELFFDFTCQLLFMLTWTISLAHV